MLLRFAPWKITLILLAVIVGAFFALPNVVPESQRGWHPGSPMNLGLDLRGGASILLEVDPNELRTNRLREISRDVRDTLLDRPRVGARRETNEAGDALIVTVTDPADMEEAVSRIREVGAPPLGSIGVPNSLNVQTRGDSQIVVSLTDDAFTKLQVDALENSIEGVRRRVDATGTLEPNIQKQGDNRILVEVPGLADPAPLIDLLTQAGVLTFNMVDGEANPAEYPLGEEIRGRIALESEELGGATQVLFVDPIITGSDLSGASQIFDEMNRPAISFSLRAAGAQRFGTTTAENRGELFAIVLDNVIISAPRINEPIPGGQGRITGSFTLQEAENLAIVLRSGALPARLQVVEQRLVGPGLGADSIRSGVTASLVGLALVAVFMIVYYGLLGIFAVVALGINIMLLVGILSALGATLTLPGIGGILLTVGMAVDANVLVFERIREEKRNGRSPMSSVETGYKQAASTILDANITTLLATIILYAIGSGPVRGFAVTLSIGVITSIFTAFVVTRWFVSIWLKSARPKWIPLKA